MLARLENVDTRERDMRLLFPQAFQQRIEENEEVEVAAVRWSGRFSMAGEDDTCWYNESGGKPLSYQQLTFESRTQPRLEKPS